MKLNVISAYIIAGLSLSLNAMEERIYDRSLTKSFFADESSSGFFDVPKPHIDLMNPMFEQEIGSLSDEEQLSSTDSYASADELDPDEILRDPVLNLEDKHRVKKWQNEFLTAYDVALYGEDETYQHIPEKDRVSFMKKEVNLKRDENSFYCKMRIYEIASAKKRYEAIKYYENEKITHYINAFVYGELAVVGASLAGVGIAWFMNNRK